MGQSRGRGQAEGGLGGLLSSATGAFLQGGAALDEYF